MGQTVARFPDAQWINRSPGKVYYQGLEHYRNGNLLVATEAFEAALVSATQHENGQWIDAIPAHAMLGECYYHLGDLRKSLLHVEASIDLFKRHSKWFDAVNWSETEQPKRGHVDERATRLLERPLSVLSLPDVFVLDVSKAKLPPAKLTKGLMTIAGQSRLDAIEIVRGVAVASYRRRVIVGAGRADTAATDASQDSTSPLSERHTETAHRLFAAVALLADFAGGREQDDEAMEASAGIDDPIHPLTPLIYLAAARVAIENGADARASDLAWSAAQSAAALGQTDYFVEAALQAVRLSDSKSLALRSEKLLAASISFLQRGRLAAMGALMAVSDASLQIGDATVAAPMAQQAVAILQRGDMHQPRWAAHADYLLARVYASQGMPLGSATSNELDGAIARVIKFSGGNDAGPQSVASPRRFQLNRVISNTTGTGKGESNDRAWLKRCTDDPPFWLWKVDPIDAISFVSMDRSAAYQMQLRFAMKHGDGNEMVTIADALLRHRFLSQLPLGGRLQQIRNLVSADAQTLEGDAAEQRLNSTGRLRELIDRVAAVDAGAEANEEDIAILDSIATEIALSSEAIASTVPPSVQIEQTVNRMSAGMSLLIYIDLVPETAAFLVTADGVRSWSIPNSRTIQQEVVGLISDLGVAVNRAGKRMSTADQWPASARKLCERLIPPEHLESIRGGRRLVVVPDGVLWYVPFELLLNDQAQKNDGKLSVSYSPTPGLAFANNLIEQSDEVSGIAVVPGKLLAPQDETLENELFQQVVAALGTAMGDGEQMPIRKDAIEYRFDKTVKKIVILDFLRPQPDSPLRLSLINKGRADSISDWMRLPRHVPDSIFIPGYQSGSVLVPIGDGRDLFQTVAALHCSGVKDVWISRWCVGGESTAILMRELLQELPYETTELSLNRAVGVLRRHVINPSAEPLITGDDAERSDVVGNHPLFWSGYLLSTPVEFDDAVDRR